MVKSEPPAGDQWVSPTTVQFLVRLIDTFAADHAIDAASLRRAVAEQLLTEPPEPPPVEH
jgi:hypothetical protein